MYILASIVMLGAAAFNHNDILMITSGLFGIAGAIELVGSNLNDALKKKTNKQ